MQNQDLAIQCRNIMKDFKMGDIVTNVLKNISLEIKKGEFVSIVGPSGSGKSTLLYIMGGLDQPTKGEVYINNMNITRFEDEKISKVRRNKIGFIFQFYNLIPNLTVEENILLPILLDGKNKTTYKKDLNQVLEWVGLTNRRKHKPKELSGGQQQRVAIARSLITKPEILFADEPTGNLDSKTGTEIMELLKEINKNTKQTIVMVTHSQEATKYTNRVITVKDGIVKEQL